jgi:hypothetical protein
MILPVTEMGKLLLNTRRAQITGTAFVYRVIRIIGIERKWIGDVAGLRKGARLAAEFGRQCAGADHGIGIDVAIGRKKQSLWFSTVVVHRLPLDKPRDRTSTSKRIFVLLLTLYTVTSFLSIGISENLAPESKL